MNSLGCPARCMEGQLGFRSVNKMVDKGEEPRPVPGLPEGTNLKLGKEPGEREPPLAVC